MCKLSLCLSLDLYIYIRCVAKLRQVGAQRKAQTGLTGGRPRRCSEAVLSPTHGLHLAAELKKEGQEREARQIKETRQLEQGRSKN